MTLSPVVRHLLRYLALAYIAILVIVPVALILWRTFAPGVGAFFESITTPAAVSALQLSLLVVAIVVPLNVLFGVPTHWYWRATGSEARAPAGGDRPPIRGVTRRGRCRVDPAVGVGGLFGFVENNLGLKIIFGFPGIVLASISSRPVRDREVEPVLHEIGTDQEEAAATLGSKWWQRFWRVTLPSIRWG